MVLFENILELGMMPSSRQLSRTNAKVLTGQNNGFMNLVNVEATQCFCDDFWAKPIESSFQLFMTPFKI